MWEWPDNVFFEDRQRVKIRIIGGLAMWTVCSAYSLRGSQWLGRCDTVIPHRMKDGYGLNDHLIEQAKEDGIDKDTYL